jgi:hypothetical protein
MTIIPVRVESRGDWGSKFVIPGVSTTPEEKKNQHKKKGATSEVCTPKAAP